MAPLINVSRTPHTIVDDPAEKDHSLRSASPPSIIQTPFTMVPSSNILPDCIVNTPADYFEKKASSSLKIETMISSDKGLDVSSDTPVICLGETQKTESSVFEENTEVLPLQDDDPESPIMTVRSVLTGVILAVFGVSVTQLFLFKPVHMQIKLMFLQKETAFSALMGTTASVATLAAEMIVVYDLYFDQKISLGVAFGILMSSQLLGFAWAGILQPILVYPMRNVFPETLPSVSLLHSLFSVGSESEDQVKFFKKSFLAIGIYEIFPTYITPAFQAINVFCLTLPKNQLITDIFGGARPFQGMGLFSFSADWTMVGGLGPLYMPLTTQFHQLLAWVISTLAFFLVYSTSWFGGGLNQKFPFLSASLFTADGEPYPYRHAVNPDGTANEEFIEKAGIPFYTGTFYLVQVFLSLCLTSAVSHAVFQNYRLICSIFKKSKSSEEIDPNRIACLKYKDFPLWGFAVIAIVAIGLTFGMSALSNSGISVPALIVSLMGSFLLTLGTGFIFAISGFVVRLSTGIQMLGGLLFPGNVFGSMWFTIYGGTSAYQGLNMLKNMKYGQYIHLPPRLVVYSQLIGCTVGSFVTLLVVKAILKNEREVLLSPHGNGVFSGAEIAAFHARAVSWGIFARRMFLSGQKYSAVSWGMLIGFFLPVPFFVGHKFFPRLKFDHVIVPLFFGIIPSLYTMAYAGETMRIVVGLLSQLWARRFHKYNYILSAALDGGTELVVFILAMAFQGGGGHPVKFPTYFLNPPMSTPRDYCYVESDAHGSG
ncbi:hypothetical protein PtB15_2B653 [Puccinia triticina]|nr:hypothetical protein PtB15_2B653 [Puccinia triticina]